MRSSASTHTNPMLQHCQHPQNCCSGTSLSVVILQSKMKACFFFCLLKQILWSSRLSKTWDRKKIYPGQQILFGRLLKQAGMRKKKHSIYMPITPKSSTKLHNLNILSTRCFFKGLTLQCCFLNPDRKTRSIYTFSLGFRAKQDLGAFSTSSLRQGVKLTYCEKEDLAR